MTLTDGDPRPLFQLQGLSLSRRTPTGEVALLQDIDLTVEPGQWVAVLGTNGSGKSSLLRYLAGDESPVADQAAIMFQDPDEQLIATTVAQELALGQPDLDVVDVLADFGLAGTDNLNPRALSAGQKQRLVLAVATAGRPQLLLCDEPTALQDRHQAGWVLDYLDQWRRSQTHALITATQDPAEAVRADWILILEDGHIVEAGPAQDVLPLPRAKALLDRPFGVIAPKHPTTAQDDDIILSAQSLGCRFTGPVDGFEGIDLRVKPGDRWGLTGNNGCGKSTLLAMCCGARWPDVGQITLAGRTLYQGSGLDLDHGLALLAPQFPEYLFTRSSVREEIGLDPRLGRLGVDEVLSRAGLSPDLAHRHPHALSSGQRRRLALALVILSERPLLLLDEPTTALDGAGRRVVLDLLNKVPPNTALIIASHDQGFLEAAGCRVLSLENGRLSDGSAGYSGPEPESP